jgi:hypothetical protein
MRGVMITVSGSNIFRPRGAGCSRTVHSASTTARCSMSGAASNAATGSALCTITAAPAGVAAGQCDLRRRQRCARLLGGYRETFPVNTSRVVVVLDGHQPAAQPRHLRRELSGFGVLFNRKHIRKIRSGEPGPQNGCHKSVYRPLRAVNAGAGGTGTGHPRRRAPERHRRRSNTARSPSACDQCLPACGA